jgi:hypothetical protein
MSAPLDIYIGWDRREIPAYQVLHFSLWRRTSQPLRIRPLMLQPLRFQGLYYRKHEVRRLRNGGWQLWDVISEAPMATEFAISRFIPIADRREGWSVFMDCDFLALGDIADLFALADDRYAIQCVQHHHVPPRGRKMDGQEQVRYARKNWSSLMLVNHAHPANARLTLDMVNQLPGRDLHRFCWLQDDEIGALPPVWNYLVGHTKGVRKPRLVHFTDGYPLMPGYQRCRYAPEWRREHEILRAYTAPISAASDEAPT